MKPKWDDLDERERGSVIGNPSAEARSAPLPPHTRKDTMTETEKLVELIARVCHEANRAYALATGEDPAVVFPSWETCPEEIRNSARQEVQKALDGATPEALHESWSAQKVADGWTFGAVKDFTAKTHPCLVDYDELPEAQRTKDALFLGIVNGINQAV